MQHNMCERKEIESAEFEHVRDTSAAGAHHQSWTGMCRGKLLEAERCVKVWMCFVFGSAQVCKVLEDLEVVSS